MSYSSIEDLPVLNSRAAFVDRSNERVFREDAEFTTVTIDDVTYVPWGADNMMPYQVIDLIESDETMTTCLQFTAEVCYGSGLTYDCALATAETAGMVEDFLLDNPMPSYWLGVSQDFKHFAFAVSEIILNAEGTRIVSLRRKEAAYCRFAPADSRGTIPYILYANWRLGPGMQRGDIERVTLLDPSAPWRDLAIKMGRAPGADGIAKTRTNERKFAIVTLVPTADSTYYPIPFYASLIRSKWYNIKRLIGVAKESKLKNTAPIRYHIEVSMKYWEGLFRQEGITDRSKQQERIVREKQQILDFLTGVENSGKVWFSTYYITPDGKEQHEVVINKIDSAKEGGDWETDIQEAVNMICFAMRVHSNLVGSVPGKAQTNNSGSDKRELYTIAQALQKPYRDLLFDVHRIIIRYNQWEGVTPQCPFMQLTTLDNHTDAQPVSIK